ncbi:MAG: sulfatase [Bryobacteraceae bacterium]
MASLWNLKRASAEQSEAAPRKRPPNIVILLCDDLGYGDVGCYGNQVIRTPRIDGMAAEGVRLTEFYATPTCTPTRASLLTGRYPLRSGLTRVLIPREHFGIPDSEITLGDALKQRGYRTACIGKWHLGDRPPYRPNRHGFDSFYGLLYSNDMTLPLVNWPPIKLFRNEEIVESPAVQSTLTQRFTGEAVRFIEANKDNPFFLYVPYTTPHLPWSASADFAGKSRYGAYGDAVEEVDWSVGKILKTLNRQGLEEDTVVVFLSDNGPELITPKPGGSAGGLRGGKGSTWEGGVRVPCIVRWPNRLPAGEARPGISCTMDLFATFAELAGVQLPPDHVVDGRNLLSFLEGKSSSPRSAHCFHRGRKIFGVRSAEWKLHFFKTEMGMLGRWKDPIACKPPELYNLEKDPGETRDLSGDYPEVVAQLTRLARDFEASIVPGTLPQSHWRSLLPNTRGKTTKQDSAGTPLGRRPSKE